jgi:hypothetical protein
MPQLTEVAPIAAGLASLTLGHFTTVGAITVVPLYRPDVSDPGWLTLAEAGGWVTITEMNDAGSVPTLTVKNNADRPVLLLDGEELLGAKQNRILNTTVLVAAHSSTTIPVSCVEQGRWSYRSRRFTSSDYWLYASLRRLKAARVSESLRQRGRHDSDQREVWHELAGKAEDLGVESPTGAMHAVYEQYAEQVKAERKAIAAADDQTGAIVYVAGEWAGMEVLAAPALFARAWRRISTGYLADALGREAGEPRIAPADVIERVRGATVEAVPAVGLGREYRLGGGQVVGVALVVDEVVALLAAFRGVVE